MRAILLAVAVVTLPTWAAAAEKPRKEPPKVQRTQNNPCAAYGAGFVKVEGTSTCLKIGGSVDAEAGGRPGR